VVLYDYGCSGCGPFRVFRPMGGARPEEPCPSCDGAARRVLTAPALGGLRPALHRALDVQAASAHEPAVVSDLPPRPSAPQALHPLHRRLPRP
jgi:putative FmdB family regulatory protein